MAGLGTRVLHRALALGHFPAAPVAPTLVSETIIGPAKRLLRRAEAFNGGFRSEIAEHLSPAAIEALAIEDLNPGTLAYCPQYSVFRLARHTATLMNFNLDGLADGC